MLYLFSFITLLDFIFEDIAFDIGQLTMVRYTFIASGK